ncbi:hypothetical protein Y032_0013g1917 [Ancylostoma ceylanicum]|uniref:Uncharacterized protein n=1 Tax=Ancylostoma ceylanicum TaxID=53326 RepID=A0A016VCL2_9BILA|nr:hypothetical protein Y032_0013g1917 [Ancylostoma ceylanicum]
MSKMFLFSHFEWFLSHFQLHFCYYCRVILNDIAWMLMRQVNRHSQFKRPTIMRSYKRGSLHILNSKTLLW